MTCIPACKCIRQYPGMGAKAVRSHHKISSYFSINQYIEAKIFVGKCIDPAASKLRVDITNILPLIASGRKSRSRITPPR